MRIDADLASGTAVATIAGKFRFSESSVRRHRARHLSASILREARASQQVGASDLIERLVEGLDDLSAARSAGLISGNVAQVIRAASASVHAVEVLLDRLGIDDAEVSRLLSEGEALARAVGAAVRANPDLAESIAVGLRARNEADAADALQHVAETARHALAGSNREDNQS